VTNSIMNISVIGGHKCSPKHKKIAYELGRLIASEGWVLVSGGREGVMEAACRGARSAGGLTVGLMPSMDGADANKYVDIVIPTGLGYARNILVTRAAQYIVAIAGHVGTLSEIAFAFNDEKKVFGIDTWDIPGVIKVKTPYEAVRRIKKQQSRC